MQPQRANGFRRPHPLQALLAEAGDDLVVEHHGAVHQTAQRQPGLFGRAHQPLGDSGCGDIAEHHGDLGTLPEFVEQSLCLLGRLRTVR